MDYSYDVSFKSLAYFMVAPTLCYQVYVLLQFINIDIIHNFWISIAEHIYRFLNMRVYLCCIDGRSNDMWDWEDFVFIYEVF